MDYYFLEEKHVLYLHARTLEVHGGATGLRDSKILDAALNMPKATYGGVLLHSDPSSIAAAYFYHLCQGHPFVDGNKRVAVLTALLFLEYNGFGVDIPQDVLTRATFSVAKGEWSKERLTQFFEESVET